SSCQGDTVVLRVDDPISGKSLSRDVDLAGAMPRARPRLVALALVELISASWSELDAPAVHAATVETHTAAPISLPLGPRDTPRLRLAVLAGGLDFVSNTDVLASGGVRLARDAAFGAFGSVGWAADAQAAHGSRRVSLGSVDVDVTDAAAL